MYQPQEIITRLLRYYSETVHDLYSCVARGSGSGLGEQTIIEARVAKMIRVGPERRINRGTLHGTIDAAPVSNMRRPFSFVIFALCGLFMSPDANAVTDAQIRERLARQASSAARTDYHQQYRSHRIGNIGFSLTNWGQFGSFRGLGCCDFCTGRPSESFTVPLGSNLNYLGEGSLWIGAVLRGNDTVVSIGTDGWGAPTEFFPRPVPDGGIIERTTRSFLRSSEQLSRCPDVFFSEDAVSEQDLITYYYDTVTNRQFVAPDFWTGRQHRPIGIEIEQKSYSWSFDYSRNFIIMDLGLRNMTEDVIEQLYMGIFMDFDVGHSRLVFGPNWDDITGFIHTTPSLIVPGLLDTVNIAWTADGDGDPEVGQFQPYSATGVAGVRVLRSPNPNLKFSFNWWVSNSLTWRDWGPVKRDSKVVFLRRHLGTPLGDIARYQMMSNGELDYDQIESAVDHQADGWLPPTRNTELKLDIANGYDTRFLLSFGPFDVKPDSVLNLTIAFVAGADFHTDARNFSRYFDPSRPQLFRDHLDFTDLLRNAQWAGWVYDTPGYDTDGDGYRGPFEMVGSDTVYYRGDGVPDYRGPPPPPAPDLRIEASTGRVVLRWNGFNTETSLDNFSNIADFEGYRVYMSRTGLLNDFAMLAQRDQINYLPYQYRPSWDRWIVAGRPLTLDSLRGLYDELADSLYNFSPFHPDSFPVALRDRALRVIVLDEFDRARLDTNYLYFVPYSSNDKVNDTTAATLSDCCGSEVTGIIRKRYPFATLADTVYDHGIAYPAYYEYEYAIEGLHVAEPVFFSVTAFDFGDPTINLKPQETAPQTNATEVWPINSASVVDSVRPEPGVYPNPYRLADDYNGSGWEDPQRQGLDPERARQVTFTNVPDTCTVSIWSLDGDLVRKLEHKANPLHTEASVVRWNLITRNTQAVKTGIYIYAIESRYGTHLGKLVIIK